MFKEDNGKISFSRISALIVVLASQLFLFVAILKGLKLDVPDWTSMGDFASDVFTGTAWVVMSLYGTNKAAEAVKVFKQP